VLTFPDCRVFSVAWSPDGKQIASGSSDTTIKIWDSQSGDCQSTLTGHSNRFFFLSSFSLSALSIGVLTSRDFRVLAVAWNPDGKQIASGSWDNTIKIWDLQSGGCQSTLTGHRYVTAPPPLPVTTVLSPTVLILQEQCPHTGYLLCHLVVTVVNVQLTK